MTILAFREALRRPDHLAFALGVLLVLVGVGWLLPDQVRPAGAIALLAAGAAVLGLRLRAA
jgi:hypothetical protein